MQETWVWSLVPEDPTCYGAATAHEPQLLSPHAAAGDAPRAGAPQWEKPPQLEKAHAQQQRPSAAINK